MNKMIISSKKSGFHKKKPLYPNIKQGKLLIFELYMGKADTKDIVYPNYNIYLFIKYSSIKIEKMLYFLRNKKTAKNSFIYE